MSKIKKRNGFEVDFDFSKITSAVKKAFDSVKEPSDVFINDLSSHEEDFRQLHTVEDIQDHIENLLYQSGYEQVYKEFVLYRANHALMREAKTKDLFDSIINTERNDVTRDNANMNSDTPAGMMMKFASETTKPFVDKYMISPEILDAMRLNILYPHDKDYYLTRSTTCLQHPLDKILSKGFSAGHGAARPAKRIETAAVLAAIAMETIQNEQHGGQAIPAFDFYMAPYVRMTYEEEVSKLKQIIGGAVGKHCPRETKEDYQNKFWERIKNAKVEEYTIVDVNKEHPTASIARFKHLAINNTVARVHQAMESFIHNMNSIHSRGGNQVVFSSINYGTDTSAEGRCVIRELLLSTLDGVGNHATAIFPIQIWKMKSGVSIDPTDKNYDLYKLACKVSAKRFFPNFLNLDSSFNMDNAWKKNDPRRFEHEVATMGCRTRVYENRFGKKTSIGRGNISFTTLNLPKIAIMASIDNGYIYKNEAGEYAFNTDPKYMTPEEIDKRVKSFINYLQYYTKCAGQQLHERFEFQKTALKKQFPLLMAGMWAGSENLKPTDTVESVLNQGTLGVGFIGLAEALVALTGKHHGESDDSQTIGLSIISDMKFWINELSKKYQHNYAVLATPAEGLSGRFTVVDQKEYGKLPGVTDREYYTNSNHVPVYYQCTAKHKAEIECPYHSLTLGGHIFYVEVDTDITKNPDAIDKINQIARANDGGYISINHSQSRCPCCNYETNDPEEIKSGICPVCGEKLDILQRITGYLVGTTDSWNDGKLNELHDRVIHVKK